ncbi:uncharacterized protein N0V89_002161 [Didymosphaeria variabile]|uniref:Uncharacterized protein n=1 Tax=Didymosphaeria variabile TaxID=1932322 RepID=A0A9W8XTW7_9PLEO|nr:uncharacterized protein N0V89_002161 [Didymosphaeria variabile]KAJ4357585.1 hypothetical protein N0V89_002161 [Didymosphaeria variabile]
MARLNPHPAPSPRAHSGPASPRLKYTASCPLLRTQGSRTSSRGDARTPAEQERVQTFGFHASLSDQNEEPRPRLIIARTRRRMVNPNLTIRKKTSRLDLSRPDLSRIYPFLSNVVYLEVPDDSDGEHEEHRGNDEESERTEVEEQYVEVTGSSDEEHGKHEGCRGYSEQEEQEGDEEREDDDSAYGSVEIPAAACPNSIWTYAAICKWRDAVEMVPLSPPKVVPKIDVRKRATPKTPRKSPSKRLLTF